MKYALTSLLGIMGTIASLTPAYAQTYESYSFESYSLVEPQRQSEILSPQPLTINQSLANQDKAGFTKNELNRVANSIEANPARANGEAISIPANLRDLFRVPSKPLEDSHPLEQFQPPAPNRSFGINLNGL